ncbi:MAG: Gfo/Idh/MocA family oxidoreductase [Verrucomicrobiaceae bacterium]|nr:MAG: Gfo/Idh/MocA family oxidoreductase [Verrucomicrobiaceae bacterium]
MNARPIRYGLIGCGGFGRFCLRQYQAMDGLLPVAVADVAPAMARKTAEEFGLDFEESVEALIARPDIDLVHLATPPGTHFALACAAMAEGKHVLCEKPLALTPEDAARMIQFAESHRLVLAVNLIMRYNPLNAAVHAICRSGLLGSPLYGTLINLAQDEVLPATHWFWNAAQSGGIFIEHGVHFFDLFEWWFGPGKIVSAEQLVRPGTNFVDQVHCAARYGELTLGTFYHGFHQSSRQDRQDWELVFEKGVIRMSGWVPLSIEADVFLTRVECESLAALLPEAQVRVLEEYGEDRQQASSRHQPRTIELHVVITSKPAMTKENLYGSMLRHLMEDQVAAIRNPEHHRLVTESNGLSSLKYACEAQHLADSKREHT